MKITFNKINEILEENSACDFLDCDADQTRLNFGEQTIIVKILKTKKFSDFTGLHIRNVKTEEELERLLLNAIDRALAANFETIYVHNKG